jgi:hypothetical protein
MRRRIEVFQGFVNTSFFFLDPLFSSLPLPRGDDRILNNEYRTRNVEVGALLRYSVFLVHYSTFIFYPLDPLQKLLIKTTDYTDYTDFFISFISVISVISVAKKILKGGSLCQHYPPMSHT